MNCSKKKWYNRERAIEWMKKRKREKRKISTEGPDGIIWINIQRRKE